MSALELTTKVNDPWGTRIRILTAVMAILLTVFSITAHRTHSHAMGAQKDVSELWSRYQAKRIRDYQLQLNSELVSMLAPTRKNSEKILKTYRQQHAAYVIDLQILAEKAKQKENEAQVLQLQALWLDFSIGMIETALVLCSLYFIANKRIFPLFGIMMAAFGLVTAMLGCFA
jgi:hypothetical protein